MRPRFAISLIVIALIILVVAFWLRPKGRSASSPLLTPQSATRSDSNSPAIVKPITNPSQQQQQQASTPPLIPAPETHEQKTERIVREANEPYETPIMFYGRVIDQDSNSLSGVKIKASVLYEHLFMPTPSGDFPITNTIHRFDKETGADGAFQITGVTGRNVDIDSVEKDGYELEPGLLQVFGSKSGSFENPVIFKMWNTNIHEQLITGNKSFEVVPDGRSYFINLTEGTISESAGGDLKVWIQYTNQVVQGQLYDWSAGIETINGGLLEVQQAAINSGFWPDPPFAMYSAPTDGYIPSFSLKKQIKGGQSGEIGNRYFYLLLNNGKEYGRMSINLFAPYGHLHPGLIRISYAINPSGSRILR